MKNQQGQVLLVLILIVTVALAIGISVIQRSLSDVSTSSQVEQSARAFSAAEAGIEKYLSGDTTTSLVLDNNSSAVTLPKNKDGLVPAVPVGVGVKQDLMECPPGDSTLAKEDIGQVWLADPTSNLPKCDPGKICYSQPTLDVYWGNPKLTSDLAALEVTVVYYDGSKYNQRKWYLDQITSTRTPPNGFDTGANCSGSGFGPFPYSDGITFSNAYRCKYTLGAGVPGSSNEPLQSDLMLLRARLLYNTNSQPFAVQAVGNCSKSDTSACLPPQAKTLISTGVSGKTQRKVQVCQLEKVVPFYFDYAIFSASDITK